MNDPRIPCAWCGVRSQLEQLAQAESGPGAGLRFCGKCTRRYCEALAGEPNWQFMLGALAARREREAA